MKRSYCAAVGLFSLFISGCIGASSTSGRLEQDKALDRDRNEAVKADPTPSVWTRIELPTEQAERFVAENGKLFVIGVDGIVEVGPNYELTKIALPSEMEELLSKDGGLTFISKHEKAAGESDDLCHPESAALVGDRLYAVGPCEHTSQLWSFGLDKATDQRSFTIGFTYSTFPKSNSGDRVYGPSGVAVVENRVIFPSQLQSGPAILTISQDEMTLRPIWRGNAADGKLLSVDFVGAEGFMLTSNGSVFRSSDAGVTWNQFAKIPSQFIGKVWGIKFRDSKQGYIFGQDGIILKSVDSGRSWTQERLDSNGSLYQMVVDNDRALVLADFQSMFLSENGKDWKGLNFANGNRIDDVIFHSGKVFVLSESALYRY